jgi:hypothetical protein
MKAFCWFLRSAHWWKFLAVSQKAWAPQCDHVCLGRPGELVLSQFLLPLDQQVSLIIL